jgi:hypothetical protein
LFETNVLITSLGKLREYVINAVLLSVSVVVSFDVEITEVIIKHSVIPDEVFVAIFTQSVAIVHHVVVD